MPEKDTAKPKKKKKSPYSSSLSIIITHQSHRQLRFLHLKQMLRHSQVLHGGPVTSGGLLGQSRNSRGLQHPCLPRRLPDPTAQISCSGALLPLGSPRAAEEPCAQHAAHPPPLPAPLRNARGTGLSRRFSSQTVHCDLYICVFKHFPKYC